MNTIRRLRLYYLFIIICMVVFFNIERLDFGQENTINIQSEIYILGAAAVLLTLFVPRLYHAPVVSLLIFWAAVYLGIKLLPSSEHPIFGGVYYYLTITELVFVLLLVFLTQRLARILEEYISATEILSLVGIDIPLPDLKEVDEQIQSEINRSRHFGRPMSIALVKADPKSTQIILPSLLAEIQASFIQRYLNAKVAPIIKRELRRMDILATDHKAGRLIIVNPETNAQDSYEILNRIKAAVTLELGISLNLSTASFPDQAYSFEDLLKIADKELRGISELTTPIPPLVVAERKVDV